MQDYVADELPTLIREAAPASGCRRKLLYIEDTPANLLLVRQLMALRPQFEFSSADCGRAGLAQALQQRPDVILLDMQLPDLHGSQVLRALRSTPELAHCKVIALSANAQERDIQAALALGFDDYWTKPLEMGRFLRGLDALLASAP
jgi:CheY-like chemotaxis protein